MNIYRLVRQGVSSITVSDQFLSCNNADLSIIQTNVVPKKTLLFPLVSYVPLVKPTSVGFGDPRVKEITRDCFDHAYQMVSCKPQDGN
jgi:tubulin alpha